MTKITILSGTSVCEEKKWRRYLDDLKNLKILGIWRDNIVRPRYQVWGRIEQAKAGKEARKQIMFTIVGNVEEIRFYLNSSQ